MGFSGAGRGLQLQAATPVAGYSLINGTGNVITWTAPNDGQNHRFMIFSSMNVTVAETGGLIQYIFNAPGGGATAFFQLFAAGQGTGSQVGSAPDTIIGPGTTVFISQNSALTAGTAVLYAEIWGS